VCIGHHIQKSRFARVREPDQTDIRDGFHHEAIFAFLPRLTERELTRGLIGRRLKGLITLTTKTTFE